MSDLTVPGESGSGILSVAAGHAWSKASEPWIVPGVDLAGEYTALDETQLDGFRHATTSGLDVTIAAGEAYVAGWLCRDRTTTVTLPASATTTIYVGYDAGAVLAANTAPADSENIRVGPAADFDPEDPRAPLYEFVTDATTVTSATDLRKTTQPVEFDAVADRVNVTSGLSVQGNLVATQNYVDSNRYTDNEARTAVTAEILNGDTIWIPAPAEPAGHPYGLRMGADGLTNYSYHSGDTTIYSMHTGGGFKLRNSYLGTDGVTLMYVDNDPGDGWIRGGWEVRGGLLDNSQGDGIIPKILGSTESLPADTQTGRIVYDPSREQ